VPVQGTEPHHQPQEAYRVLQPALPEGAVQFGHAEDTEDPGALAGLCQAEHPHQEVQGPQVASAGDRADGLVAEDHGRAGMLLLLAFPSNPDPPSCFLAGFWCHDVL